MSLPVKWVEALFTKLTLAYGRDFLGRWEGIDLADVKTDWGHELAGFEKHPEAIAYALANLPIKPPTVLEFRALCRRAPLPELQQLPAPPANPERIRAELAKLGPVARQSLAVGGGAANRTWAKRILERVAAGEHVGRYARESAQVAMGLRAKVSAI